MTIDSHQHFWRYDPAEYGWISESMSALRRDFLPPDLWPEAEAAGVAGVVSVQARQSVEETRFLLELARRHEFIRGVVGWIPLAAPDAAEALAPLAAAPELKACRHVLQDEADDDYMLRADFNAGIRELTAAGLAYDILIYARHLPQTIRFVDRHPRQVFVLDHLAKPRIRDGAFEPWNGRIRELARRENVYCKLSGLVTEADWRDWTPVRLAPYLETALEAFGPRRLMFGSDWPLCLLASGYGTWHALVTASIGHLGAGERAWILGGTAAEAYRIEPRATPSGAGLAPLSVAR